jgi:hypothetical protein
MLMLGLFQLQAGPLAFSFLDPVGFLLRVPASVVVSFRADDPLGFLCFPKAGSKIPQFLQNLVSGFELVFHGSHPTKVLVGTTTTKIKGKQVAALCLKACAEATRQAPAE